MQRFRVLSLLAFAGLVLSAVTWASTLDDDDGIDWKKIPKAVKKTIQRVAQGAEIDEISREREGGRIVYEVVIEVGDVEIEIEIGEDGRILDVEIETEEDEDDDDDEDENDDDDNEVVVSAKDVPRAVKKAVRHYAGDARVRKWERETDDGRVYYEAEWISGGTEHAAKVTSNGSLIELEHAVQAEDVPKAVRRAAARHLGGRDHEYELKLIAVYEVEATVHGKEREILVWPTGDIVDDDDDDDDD